MLQVGLKDAREDAVKMRLRESCFYLNKMFGLVEQPQRGVPGTVRPDRDQVLQVLKTRSQVCTAVLLQLIVGRSEGKYFSININIKM